MPVRSISLCGVGGQGTILSSKILSEGLLKLGYDVKMSEIHGMSQRGGSVITQIRFGGKVYSPIIPDGCAEVLAAFEKVEAARYISQLMPGGTLIVNDLEIYPLPVLTGLAKYPSDVIDSLRKSVENIKIVEAYDIAEKLGNPKCQNIVLLGALIKSLGIDDADWPGIMKEYISPALYEINLKAFLAGLAC